ncbi:MAG: potassium channel family protein [Bacteroidetes bacterium]|nr:potassium channel family protein [Bacteroidota bacterium]
MYKGAVLLLGNGHFTKPTKQRLTEKGYKVTHLTNLNTHLPGSESSTISEINNYFSDLDMKSFAMIYVLFEKDEDSFEVVIALIALYPDMPITASLFNENIRPHLKMAHANLTILNPAKIVAPAFVEALEGQYSVNQKLKNKPSRLRKTKFSNNLLLIILISLFGLLTFAAVSYFHFVEHLSWLDSLYFIVVTMSTVGYGDFNLIKTAALSKIVGIIVILSSSIFLWLIFSLILDRVLKSRAQRLMGRKKYNYKNHIILCGLGRLGYFIADELIKKGEKIIIVESNQDSPNIEYFRNLDVDVYNGDARLPYVLEDVGAEHCRALISAIDDDYGNLEIGLNARYFQPNIRLVLRILDESMAIVIKEKFDIHLTKSMSFIAAEKLVSVLEKKHHHSTESK